MPEHRQHSDDRYGRLRNRTVKRQRARGLDVEDAEDTAHDAIVTTLEQGSKVKDESIEGFVDTTARRKLLDLVRRKSMFARRHIPIKDESTFNLHGSQTPEQAVIKRERSAHLRSSIAKLPDEYRTVVELSLEGYSDEEISEMTHVKHGTVRSRLTKGRARLRDIMEAK
jgi:RNA polymerase sigma-70 factor (ECF subfamily)